MQKSLSRMRKNQNVTCFDEKVVLTLGSTIQIVVLTPVVPKNKKSLHRLSTHLQQEFTRPILCCRETESTKTHNWIDDTHEHIGQYSFQDSKNEILRCLQEVSNTYKSAVVAGHSLGGALAQAITGEFCDQTTSSNRPLIHSLYDYNASGVGDAIAAKYQIKMDQLPKNRRPKVMRYHHAADVVGLAGGAHLKADIKKELGEMSFFPHVIRKAHSWLQLISELNAKKMTSTSLKRRFARSIAETFRQLISLIVQKILLTQMASKRALKTVAKEIADLLQIENKD